MGPKCRSSSTPRKKEGELCGREKCPGGICPGEYADMKLNMRVVWTKMQVDFKDGRGTNTQQVTDGFLSYLGSLSPSSKLVSYLRSWLKCRLQQKKRSLCPSTAVDIRSVFLNPKRPTPGITEMRLNAPALVRFPILTSVPHTQSLHKPTQFIQ